jgi:amino acid transporter
MADYNNPATQTDKTMEFIQLTQTTSELNNQLTFLIRREFYVKYNKYRKRFFIMAGLILLVLALLTFTEADSFITAKAVSSVIAAVMLLILLFFSVIVLVKWHKKNRWKRRYVKEAFVKTTIFQFAFDEEKLYFVSENYSMNFKWDYYKYYAINKNSIFIFTEKNIYEAVCFSQNEIGIDNYDRLNKIASEKLIPLP